MTTCEISRSDVAWTQNSDDDMTNVKTWSEMWPVGLQWSRSRGPRYSSAAHHSISTTKYNRHNHSALPAIRTMPCNDRVVNQVVNHVDTGTLDLSLCRWHRSALTDDVAARRTRQATASCLVFVIFYCNTCLLHYWLNRGKWFSIIRLYIVIILFCESCVLCIVMKPKHSHLCITIFLDTQAVLTLKGPFGRVL